MQNNAGQKRGDHPPMSKTKVFVGVLALLTAYVLFGGQDNTPPPEAFTQTQTTETLVIDYPVILPDDTTTVTVCILVQTPEGEDVYVPEESPEGGHFDGWLDNSPSYADRWMLQVNELTHTTQWVAPAYSDSDTEMVV